MIWLVVATPLKNIILPDLQLEPILEKWRQNGSKYTLRTLPQILSVHLEP